MRPTTTQLELLALCKVKGVSWYLIARESQHPGGVERLWAARPLEQSKDATAATPLLQQAADQRRSLMAEAEAEVDRAVEAGATLVTAADESYPATLRLIYNAPPFLFIRGRLTEDVLRSVAVVGTRTASPDGLARAARMARLLSERGISVVSGLARGVDTAAHTATLDSGGRTVAVIGTGISQCYPAENRALADRIIDTGGAVVSQFWPNTPPASYTFPRRNVTMSGLAQGTVVIEASSTSGAKMQARLALEHGKKLFLIKSLTEQQEWARKYVTTRGATQIESVDEVIAALAAPERVQAIADRRMQLALDLG